MDFEISCVDSSERPSSIAYFSQSVETSVISPQPKAAVWECGVQWGSVHVGVALQVPPQVVQAGVGLGADLAVVGSDP